MDRNVTDYDIIVNVDNLETWPQVFRLFPGMETIMSGRDMTQETGYKAFARRANGIPDLGPNNCFTLFQRTCKWSVSERRSELKYRKVRTRGNHDVSERHNEYDD